jgi:hypothetical protein
MSDLLKEFDQAMLTRASELGRAGGLSVVEPVSGIAETEIGKTRAETGRPKSAGHRFGAVSSPETPMSLPGAGRLRDVYHPSGQPQSNHCASAPHRWAAGRGCEDLQSLQYSMNQIGNPHAIVCPPQVYRVISYFIRGAHATSSNFLDFQ